MIEIGVLYLLYEPRQSFDVGLKRKFEQWSLRIVRMKLEDLFEGADLVCSAESDIDDASLTRLDDFLIEKV